MKINKAYKFRLYPNEKQKTLINKTFGCTRFVYNYYLNQNIKLDMKNKIITLPKLKNKKQMSTVATIGI